MAVNYRLFLQGVPPAPPPFKKLMGLRRQGAGTESSPHTWRWRFARKGKYNRLGLDGVTRITLPLQGAGGITCPSALAASVKVFAGCRGLFSKSRPAGEPSADGGAKPHSLSPLQGQVSISQKWYNLLHQKDLGVWGLPQQAKNEKSAGRLVSRFGGSVATLPLLALLPEAPGRAHDIACNV